MTNTQFKITDKITKGGSGSESENYYHCRMACQKKDNAILKKCHRNSNIYLKDTQN